jgi:UDP-N-acetylglucosamine 4,6-dehydratase
MDSHQLAKACIDNDVDIVTGLSTDKAVKAVNAMGTSTAMMEKLFCSRNLQRDVRTRFSCTRYGNILGSRGSVLPLSLACAGRGEPLPITNPYRTPFLRSVDESVDLVLHALAHARGGALLVKTPPACTVSLLADAVQALPRKPAKTELVGVRPGEKLHELLGSEDEMHRAGHEGDFFTVLLEGSHVDSPVPFGVEYPSRNTRQVSAVDELVGLLHRSLRTIDGTLTARGTK